MFTLITYDLVNMHTAVKDAMKAKGYADRFWYDNRWVVLPNTTLYHQTKTPAEAREDLRATCTSLGATLERCIAVRVDGWASWG